MISSVESCVFLCLYVFNEIESICHFLSIFFPTTINWNKVLIDSLRTVVNIEKLLFQRWIMIDFG